MMGSLTLRDGGHSASKTRVNALEATSSAGGERTASHLLVHHAVAQRTDAGDLDLEHVTGLHPQWWIAAMADPFRRAGGDHVTRQERREVRAERDDLRHRIDQEIGGGLLPLLPVQPRREREAGRIRDLVGGDDPGPERTRGGEILSRRHGEFLIVAHAAVDEAGIAGDVVERALDRDMAAAAT